MSQSTTGTLKKTALNAWHRAHGARMVELAGWDMPVAYGSVADEHMAVRTCAGLFDLSHLGQIEVAGPGALATVQHVTCNDVSRLEVGQAHRSGLMTARGTFVDDLLVCRLARSHFLLVVNAANVEKDFACIAAESKGYGDASAVNSSSRYAMLAVQGPRACAIVQELTSTDLEALEPCGFAHGEVAGARATILRTGSTGEDGLELLVPPSQAVRVADALMAAGQERGLAAAGLGALDTLRLEAGLRLHGQDIDETTSVLEADLEGLIGWEKPEFLGRDALVEQKARGPARKLVGFEMVDGAIACRGCDILDGGARIGVVTSAAEAPFIGKAIGLAWVPAGKTAPGTEFEIDVRGRRARARVVPTPFYKRPRG